MERKLVWLEVMRGFAALWVLMHHADLSTSAFFGDLGSSVISRGYLGVDFFFILSGFIIAMASERMIKEGRGIREYFALRLSRVYAAYLPIGIALFFAYQFFPGLSESDRDVGAISSFTLAPTDLPPALSVAWTLQHEVLFYLIFSTVFISKWCCRAFLASWLAFIAYSWGASATYDTAILRVLAHPLNLWFFAGISIFLVKEFEMKAIPFSAAVILLGLAVLGCAEAGYSRAIIGLLLSALILLFSKVKNIRAQPPIALMYLGAASYSIYLVHNPVQSVISRIVPSLIPGASPIIAFCIIAIGSLIAGFIYYSVLEVRVTRYFKRIIKARIEAADDRTAAA